MFEIQVKTMDGYFATKISVEKRCLDLFGAVVGILSTLPLLIILSVYIKLVSPGPVLFNQTRIGRGGKKFICYKFRTMHPDVDTQDHQRYLAHLINGRSNTSETEIPMIKLEDDAKIIPLGTLIRSLGLDELPQLFNVLKGEMSLVGPRPAIPYEIREYQLWHKQRLDVTPGITGLWQVSGKNKLSFKKMIRLDLQYVKEQSIWLDVVILAKTPQVVLLQAWEQIKDKITGLGQRRTTK